MAENVQVFNPHTGLYEKPKAEHRALIAEHEAQIAGKPAPGDRTLDELRGLEPGFAGPVVTAAAPNEAPAENANAGTRARNP